VADSLRAALRVPSPLSLTDLDPRATPLAPGDKKQTKQAMADDGARLAELQERLYAEGVTGGRRRVLLVLQGMDTSGKGGVITHVVGLVDPLGVAIHSFKKPTPEELAHDFLWRVRPAVPAPGRLGVFDRSHYEDVLIGRVRQLAPAGEIERRYGAIADFERELADDGVTFVKCMLHVSPAAQLERLEARLDDPAKHWKYNPGDLDERALWPAYRQAYEIALERTDTDRTPWYVVPADRKWYRNWAVARLLLETLTDLDPHPAPPDFDVEAERRRLREAPPVS
jgi:PPK2 family polyphosphate:nucleotide phosphotransferase